MVQFLSQNSAGVYVFFSFALRRRHKASKYTEAESNAFFASESAKISNKAPAYRQGKLPSCFLPVSGALLPRLIHRSSEPSPFNCKPLFWLPSAWGKPRRTPIEGFCLSKTQGLPLSLKIFLTKLADSSKTAMNVCLKGPQLVRRGGNC